jgi:hypothetical protein
MVSQFQDADWLSEADANGILELDSLLRQMTEQRDKELWTAGALAEAPEWEQVRKKARELLTRPSMPVVR